MAAATESVKWMSVMGDGARPKAHRLSPAENSTFQDLRAQYLGLDSSDGHPNARALAEGVIGKDRDGQRLTLNDIYALETALVRLESFERVRERLRAMIATYSHLPSLLGQTIDFGKLDETATRARAEQLLDDIHAGAIASRRNLELCSRWTRWLSITTLIVIIAIFCTGYFFCDAGGAVVRFTVVFKGQPEGALPFWKQIAWTLPYLPSIFYSMMWGVLGAFLSSLLRVKTLATALAGPLGAPSDQNLLTAILNPLVGAFAGFFIFSFLASGFIGSSVAPSIKPLDYFPVLGNLSPIFGVGPPWGDPTEDFKLLLAGLASGFSERLFPDMLDWLSKGLQPTRPGAP